GDGDAPDGASGFAKRVMGSTARLDALEYGLLALGDRDYDDFCGFGRRLDHWLRTHGATRLFDPVEVDDGDPGAVRRWQHQLGVLSGASDEPDWQAPRYRHWRLLERHELSPGSLGGACFHVALRAEDPADMSWHAG